MAERVPEVVIVGGGFGGLNAARYLGSAPVRVTMSSSSSKIGVIGIGDQFFSANPRTGIIERGPARNVSEPVCFISGLQKIAEPRHRDERLPRPPGLSHGGKA